MTPNPKQWRRPGASGAVLYAVVAAVLGGVITMVSRLQIERQRGRRRIAGSIPDGPVIVIANHSSYADGLLLIVVCRRLGRSLRMLVTSGVFRIAVVGRVARRLGFIPVERGTANAAGSLDAALLALAEGEAVGIFPEGRLTRHPDRWPERARTGAVRLAVASGAPILPVAIEGAHRVLGRRGFVTSMLRSLLWRPRVEVRVGEPIDVGALVAAGVPGADPVTEMRRATDVVMTQLIELVEDLRNEIAPVDAGSEIDDSALSSSTDRMDAPPGRQILERSSRADADARRHRGR